VKALQLLGAEGIYFCAVLVGTQKVHGCSLPQSKILCSLPKVTAMLHVVIYTKNAVTPLAICFSVHRDAYYVNSIGDP